MSHSKKLIMISTILLGGFLGLLNKTLLTTALPRIMKDFHIEYSRVRWLTTAFLLTNGVVIPLSAFIIQCYTTRQVFLTRIIVFFLGTLLGGFNPNFITSLIAGIIQALGSGIMMPLIVTTILDIFEPHERGKYMEMFGLVIGLAPAIGPTLPGYLVEYINWRALFYVVALISVMTFILVLIFIKNIGVEIRTPIDMLSIILSVIRFGDILHEVSSISQKDWNDPVVPSTIILGIIFIVLFIWGQERLETPLLSFKAFKNNQFTVSIAVMVAAMISMIESETVLPTFVRSVLQRTPVDSGLTLLPRAIIMAIMSIVSGCLYETFGAQVLSMIGILIVMITTSYFVITDEHTSTAVLATIHAIRMTGIALGLMPVVTHTVSQLTPELNAHGSSMTNAIQQVTGSIGTAGLVTILSVASQRFKPTLSDYQEMAKTEMMKHIQTDAVIHGYHSEFLFAVIITVISLLLTFLPKRKKDLNEESR